MALVRPGQPILPRLPEIGRLFKGAPKSPKRPGEDLDHFRFEPHEALKGYPRQDGRQGNLYDELLERYNEALDSQRNLRVRFPFDDVSLVLSEPVNEVWSSKGNVPRCIRRCNGQTVTLRYMDTPQGARLTRDPVACSAKEGMDECPEKCKPTARLQVILTDLGYPGIVMLTTHSIYDISEFQANLEAYRNFPLSKIPFLLCRREKPCPHTQPDGTVINQKRWLCHIEVDPQFGQALQQAQATQFLVSLGADFQAATGLPSLRGSNRVQPMLPSAVETVEATVEPGWQSQSMQKFEDGLSRCLTTEQVEQWKNWVLGETQFLDAVNLDFSGNTDDASDMISQMALDCLQGLSNTK